MSATRSNVERHTRRFRRARPDHVTLRAVSYCLIALAALLVFRSPDAQADASFYQPDPQAVRGEQGSVIRSEPMPFAPPGAMAYRILYRSLGLHGESIPVSGVLVVPDDGADNTHRKIVAWAHPTSGVSTACAPSMGASVYREIQGLAQMLAQGFAVVATDYPGLGAPGIHPYLIGNSEGRAVLDSVRAARALLKQPKTEFAVWGHSQGGQAALFAGILAPTYAPELKLEGVAAAAPATDLATLMADDFASSGGKGLTALTLWSWSRLFHIDLKDTVDQDATVTVDRLANGCIETIFDLLERRVEERPLNRDFLKISDISQVKPWHGLMEENSPGVVPHQFPVLITQGLADTIVRPQVTADYVRGLCKAGDHVELVLLRDVGHGFIARDTVSEAVKWVADRFAGRPAPTSCASAGNSQQGE